MAVFAARRLGVFAVARIRSDVAGTVVVTSIARDWRVALDNALSRAARRGLRVGAM